jgi:hypothetical protein
MVVHCLVLGANIFEIAPLLSSPGWLLMALHRTVPKVLIYHVVVILSFAGCTHTKRLTHSSGIYRELSSGEQSTETLYTVLKKSNANGILRPHANGSIFSPTSHSYALEDLFLKPSP